MYESDYFSPNDQNEYDPVTTGKRNSSVLDDFKRKDRGCYKVTRPFNNTWKGKILKNVNITYYGSGISGTNIRHAITGEFTKGIVGRIADEAEFFKVNVATGEHACGTVHLFYNSPEEYENHQYVALQQSVKDAWHAQRG